MSLVFKLCLHVFRHIVTNELPGVSRRTRSNWYNIRYCDQSTITLRSHTKTSTLTHWVNRITRVTLCPRFFFFFFNKFTLLYSQYKNSFREIFYIRFIVDMVYRGNSVIFRTYEDERQRESIATFKNLDVDLVTFEPVSLLFFES